MKATAIIGCNFGDEGKGLITDYVCSQLKNPLVIRYNGGAQAGHTVDHEKRHVFHHFGSGTFAGAATYLSEFFIVNPLLWAKELKELDNPKLFVTSRCKLTTPYDMLINQLHQTSLGKNESCGIGINETIQRCKTKYRTEVWDIINGTLRIMAGLIRKEYIPKRLSELKLEPDTFTANLINSESLFEEFLSESERFWNYCDKGGMKSDNIVFEGAQGLLLDQDHKYFPYVTHSKTGLDNVIELSKRMRIDELDVIYVTRSYMTRHGDGPFPTEDKSYQFPDLTNLPNKFQGSLRFGWLAPQLMYDAVKKDLDRDFKINPCFAMTCLDQYDPKSWLASINSYSKVFDEFDIKYKSYGPKRKDVKCAL